MRAVRAGIYRGQLHDPESVEDPVWSIDRASATDRYETAVSVAWEVAKDAEDHPDGASLAFLVRPDGTVDQFGGGGFGGWGGRSISVVGIQWLELQQPGRYLVEIRPALMVGEGRERGIEPVGDRRLAVLVLDVL